MNTARIERRPLRATDWATGTLHPVLARIYAARDIGSLGELDHRLQRLADPAQLNGIDHAAALLAEAVMLDRCIVVVGDFDADGATGCAVGVKGLRLLGAHRVHFHVPNRVRDGYGLTPGLVEQLVPLAPEYVVTVDQGISSLCGVAAARDRGMRVIVTDHHLPGPTLPAADAIVNPNMPGDPFPSKALSGVGVLFYVLLATRAQLRARGWFGTQRAEPDLSQLLDLVALGTVADMVPLDFNNRILVAAGIKRMRRGQTSAGMRALFAVAARSLQAATTYDLGYSIGPRINAAGRLEDMRIGIECLLSEDPNHALELAAQLDAINAERRALQADMQQDAEHLLSRLALDSEHLPAGLCVHDPHWHPGVVGLVASRLKERWHRPCVALAPSEPGSALWRGSARSIGGFHVRDALADLAATHPGLIDRFGGHAMAAGLSIEERHIPAFAARFEEHVLRSLGPVPATPVLWSDGPLQDSELNLELALVLQQAGPWGQAFAEPLFDNAFEVLGCRTVGTHHQRLQLRLLDSGPIVEAMHFNGTATGTPPARIQALYQLSADEWRNERRLRLFIRHREALASA